MPMVALGVLLLLLKWAEFGPFERMSWWWALLPFGIAILWWEFADNSGWTQRRVIDKLEKRKADRRQKAMDALGLDTRREKQVTRAQQEAARRTTTTTADPTMRDHNESTRRDPRL
jgi:small Trp-rich protein